MKRNQSTAEKTAVRSSPARGSAQGHKRQPASAKCIAQTPHRSAESDFYDIAQMADPADQALLGKVRAFAEERVAPIINHYWGRAEFPFEIIGHYGALGIAGAPYKDFGCLGKSALADGLIMMELARTDCSIATFHGVHSGLAMGSIYLCGSHEQKQRWLPAMQRA